MSNKILNKVNNDIFSYDTGDGVFKMTRVMPTEIHHVTAGAGTSGYMLTSTGNGWTWTDPSTLGGGGTSLTSGTGVSITNDIISIGQSVGTTDNVTFNNIDANVSKTSNLSISSTAQVNVSATQYMSLVSQNNLDLTSNSGSVGIYVSSGNFDIYAQNIRFRDGAGTVLASDISFTNWDTAYSWGDHSVAGYLNNVSISAPVSNQFLTYDGTNWINVNPDTDDILEGPGNLYYTDERVDTRIALASLGDLSNVKATSPNVGEILSYNGTNWVRDGTIKSLTGTLDGTSYDYINVTTPQHVKASWTYTTQLELTSRDAGLLVDGGLLIKASNTPAPILDGTPLEMDFMVEGNSMLIGNTYIGPNGKLTLYSDILNNNGDVIITAGGDLASVNITLKDTIAESNGDYLYSNGILRINKDLNVSNEDGTYTNGISNGDGTYSSGSDGDVLISQGFGRPPKWIQLQSGTAYIQGEGIHINNANEINVESLYFDNWNTAYSWGDHSVAGYLNNVSISAPVSNQFLTYDGTNWINVNPDTDDIVEGPGNLYYTDERVDTRIALASLGDLSNVKATSPIVGEILSYNGTNWVRDGTIKSLTGTLDGTSYDYINVTNPQHVKAGWSYSTSLDITGKHAGMVLDGGLFISSKAPITDSSGNNKQVLGAIGAQFGGTPTDLEVDFMVEGTSMLIGDTFIGPNGNLVLFGDILSNSGQTILGSGGIVFESDLNVWNEGSDPKTYSSGLDGEVLVSQGQGRPPKWIPLESGTGGGLAAPNTASTGFILPSSNLTNYDFRTYTLSGTNDVIDSDGNVIFTSVGSGTIEVSTADGVLTSATNQYISKSGALPSIPSGNFSIEFYMRFHTTPSDYHWNIVYTNNSGVKIVQYLRANGHFYFEIHPSSNFAASRIMYYDPFNENWDTVNFNHFVFIYDGTGKFYHNGTLITGSIQTGFENSVVLGSNVSFDTLYLGGGGYASRSSFGDKLDETTKFHRMYDGALTVEQVEFLYENKDNLVGTVPLGDVTNYVLASNNADGTETKWLPLASAAGGVPAPVVSAVVTTGITLPGDNLLDHDFRNYSESGGNVIDADGNVIAAIIGGGTTFTSSEGLVTSTSNYIEITDPLPALGSTGNFSIEFYARMNDPTSAWHAYFSARNDSTDSYIQMIIKGDDAWLLEMYHNSTFRQATYRPFPVGAWDSTNFHHFILTFGGTTTEKLYMDGVEVTKLSNAYNNSITYDPYESFQRLQIAGSQGYDSNIETTKYFRLYNGVLTADEIDTLYTNRDETVGPTETVVTDVTNYALTSNNADGTETKWLSVVPTPAYTPSTTTGPTLPDGNLLDLDFRIATISGGTNVEIDGTVIGTTVGTGVTLTAEDGISSNSNSYIVLNTQMSWTINFSIELYFKLTGGNYNTIIGAWNNSSPDSHVWVARRGDGGPNFRTGSASDGYNSGNNLYSESSLAGWNGTYGHVIFTHNSSLATADQKRMYINGVDMTHLVTVYGSGNPFNPGIRDNFWIGRQNTGWGNNDDGVENLRILRVFDHVLTQDEVDTLYTNRDETYGQTETVTDVTNYALASNNADGTETKWLSVVPAPLSTSSGPALLDGNIESIDFTKATISGTNVEIDGTVIGTTVGTGVEVSETGGISTTEASYVDLNMSTGFAWTSNFTLEFYFKMPSGSVDSQQYNGLFASFNGTAGSAFGDYLVVERRDTGDGIHFYTTPANRNDGYNTLYTDSTVSGFDGTWGHLVLTNDSSQPTHLQKQMYVNGVLFTTGVLNVGSQVNFAAGTRDHYWVGRNGFGTLYENGVENLKIFRVYNRILTAQEAATLYENRDGASGSSDVTNYHLVSNNATGTVTKWEPMNSGSSRPYANLINTNGVHINLISGYTDLPFTSAILSSGIYLDSGGYLFTVNNSGVYICNVSFRLGDPDAWTSMHIRDSNNIIIATSHAIGTTNSIEAGFFFMAELNQGTSYKFTVYRNGAGATLLANAGDGYQINCLINHV